MGQSSSRPSPPSSPFASRRTLAENGSTTTDRSESTSVEGTTSASTPMRTRFRRLSRLSTLPRRLRRSSTPTPTSSSSSTSESRKERVSTTDDHLLASPRRRWPLSIRKQKDRAREADAQVVEEDGVQEAEEERIQAVEVKDWAGVRDEASRDETGKQATIEKVEGELSTTSATADHAVVGLEVSAMDPPDLQEAQDSPNAQDLVSHVATNTDAASTHEAMAPDSHVDNDPAVESSLPSIGMDEDTTLSQGPSQVPSEPSPLDLLESTPIIPNDTHISPPPAGEPQVTAPAVPERRFPPAGTLVVVQGVVHTTDVSASTSAVPPAPARAIPHSHPRPTPNTPSRRSSSVPASAGTRSRLSSLIPRPMMSRRSSLVSPNRAGASEATGDDVAAHDVVEATDAGDAATRADGTAASAPPEPAASNERPAPLSPSSIDVLGTLLSVATAATAASLVSGSSDPLFSSGLAAPSAPSNPFSSSSPSPEPDPHAHRPLSPTPTAGLGGLGGMGIPPLPASSRDRMRNAWGNIRDRFGLNAAPGAEAPRPSAPPPPGGNMDPRAQLLAEMARAFHLGMGLDGPDANGPAANGSAAPSSGSTAPAHAEDREPLTINSWPSNLAALSANPDTNVPLPPADSFERFLVDLQIDLRRTLTEERGAEPEPEVQEPQTEEEDEEDEEEVDEDEESPADEMLSWPIPVEELFADADTDGAPAPSTSEPTPEGKDASTAGVTAEPEVEEEAGPSTSNLVRRASRTSSMPSLETVSDSSSEGDDDDDSYHSDSASSVSDSSDADAEADAAPNHAADRVDPLSETFGMHLPPRATFGSQRRPGGGINWWRMYRFPPMPAPPGHVPPGAGPGMGVSPFAPRMQPQPAAGSADSAAPGGEGGNPGPADSNAGVPGDNIIVPVIVVGLQSVSGHSTQRPPHPPVPGAVPEYGDGFPAAAEQDAGTADEAGDGAANARPGTPRGRPWHSRAADAIRGLRTPAGARRGAAPAGTGAQAGEGPGSTTFFIYVIGGYYPPNHHLVTGTDPLDSFEALWELAEMLGQVKPPTVTKEEIAQSGLEVVAPADLEACEKEGRVAASCIDRCLICLEDYAPEDEVRLMSCRHAFHKSCVDQWLETGRNNCPACRSQGVATA